MLRKSIISEPFLPVYEDPPTPPADPPKDDPPSSTPSDPPKGKTYTQAEFDSHMAKARTKYQGETQKAVEELEALRAKASLTSQERSELDERIETLSNTLLTKEEVAKKDLAREQKKHQKEIEDATKERDAWKTRFTSSTIVRSLTDAAVKHKAIVPSQIVSILQPDTRLVEVLDSDGQPTGNYEAKTKVVQTDKDGKTQTLELSVADVVKQMRESEDSNHLNLFEGDGVGGVGGGNKSSKKGIEQDIRELAKNPEQYMKARREGKITL